MRLYLRKTARSLAESCARYQLEATEVIHSGKARAQETAEAIGEACTLSIRAAAGLDPLDPVQPFARECLAMHSTIVVGHLPFLERLAALLLAGREDPPVLAFQHGGMICLERRGAPEAGTPVGAWCLLWTAFPDQVHPGG
ncbi:MAG: phosphohistidine phosphatase SixA [Spirochaetes bacterium]|nr:phosphohistidine phosphatase SixA [Spirochaetota bacterium]